MFFVVATIIIFLTYFIFKSYSRPKGFPPGPRLLPLIGSWYALPTRKIENITPTWQKKYGKIIGHIIITRLVVVITGYKNVVSGLKAPNFQSRFLDYSILWWKVPRLTGLFLSNGEANAVLRQFSLRYLGTVMGPKLESIMENEMIELFSSIKLDEVIEMNRKFTQFTTNIIYSILFDKKKGQFEEEIEEMRELIFRRFKMGKPAGLSNIYPILNLFHTFRPDWKIEQTLQKYVKNHLKEHRATFDSNNLRDYVDAFLAEQEKEKTSNTNYFTDDQLLSCTIELTQASSEATASAVLFTLLLIALNPTAQTKMHEELDLVLEKMRSPKLEDKTRLSYCEAVIYETLRFIPTSPIAVPHVASEDTQFNGYIIPKDTLLYFDLRSALHDEEIFEEPEIFKPERFMNKEMKSKLVAFGLGKRSCIGEVMVKNTLFLFVSSFFQKFSIKLPEGFENPSTEPDSGFTASPKPFKLIINERK